MAELNEDFYKKRLEKDLAELKKMIETHFVLRKKDEEELQELETRISERKEMRAKQVEERAQREKERQERDRLDKEKKERDEAAKAEAEAQRKKDLMAKMTNFESSSGNNRQRKGKATARDVKKKVLAERRKPLNIDHMDLDKLKQKTKDLWDFLHTLECERFDFEQGNDDKKYEVNLLRYRANMLSGKASKENTKRIGRINLKK